MAKKLLVILALCGILVITWMLLPETKAVDEEIIEQLPLDFIDGYELQLMADAELQQKVKKFSSPDNLFQLFEQHKEQLQAFADQCYDNRKENESFFVEYIDGERFFFCTSDTDGKNNIRKETAIQKGIYSDITDFMDYAIDNGLVFKDWMLGIETPAPMNDNRYEEIRSSDHGPLLEIKIYEAAGLEITFFYSPYRCVDYSTEIYGSTGYDVGGGIKAVQIEPHWYYEYVVMQWPNKWHPELEALGFFSKEGMDDEDETIEELPEAPLPIEYIDFPLYEVAILSIVLGGAFLFGVCILLIRHHARHKKKNR